NLVTTLRRIFFPLFAGAALGSLLAAAGPEEKPAVKNPTDKAPTNTSAQHTAKAPQVDFAAEAGLKPIGDWAIDPGETQQLSDIFAAASQAAAQIQAGSNAGFQRRSISLATASE